MINQSLAKELEFSDPKLAIGEKVLSGRDTLEIAGVIEDFHQMSLKTPIIPLVCRLGTPGSYYSIKLETSNYKDVIKSLESQWEAFFPGNPIDYFFLDYAEQFSLHGQWQLTDLVQEDRAARRKFKFSQPPIARARKRTTFMAKQFILDECLWNRRAVNCNEGTVAPARKMVDRSREELLAGPRFTE